MAENAPGNTVEHEITALKCEDLLTPASAGLSIAEGKNILENLQKHMVAVQVQHHNHSLKSCFQCGRSFRTERLLQIDAAFGVQQCSDARTPHPRLSCTSTQHRSYLTIFTHRNPITPELRYLAAKLAALLPFGKVMDFLSPTLVRVAIPFWTALFTYWPSGRTIHRAAARRACRRSFASPQAGLSPTDDRARPSQQSASPLGERRLGYGNDGKLRLWLEEHRITHVLGVSGNQFVTISWKQ